MYAAFAIHLIIPVPAIHNPADVDWFDSVPLPELSSTTPARPYDDGAAAAVTVEADATLVLAVACTRARARARRSRARNGPRSDDNNEETWELGAPALP
eukprot:3009173-Alexandrium_andersonii.AAC.1